MIQFTGQERSELATETWKLSAEMALEVRRERRPVLRGLAIFKCLAEAPTPLLNSVSKWAQPLY